MINIAGKNLVRFINLLKTQELYITQEESDVRVVHELSQEIIRTESIVVRTHSKPYQFLLFPQAHYHSGPLMKTSRYPNRGDYEANEESSEREIHPAVVISLSHSSQEFNPEETFYLWNEFRKRFYTAPLERLQASERKRALGFNQNSGVKSPIWRLKQTKEGKQFNNCRATATLPVSKTTFEDFLQLPMLLNVTVSYFDGNIENFELFEYLFPTSLTEEDRVKFFTVWLGRMSCRFLKASAAQPKKTCEKI